MRKKENIKIIWLIAILTIIIEIVIAIVTEINNISIIYAYDEQDNEEIPSYFNLADSYNLKVENQGSEGNCWTFASLNSLETYLMMHGYGEYDFSERHLSIIESTEFYGTRGQSINRKPNTNGNFEEAIDYIINGYGPVLEQDFPYNVNYTIDDYENLLNITPVAYVGSYMNFPSIIKDEYNKTDINKAEEIRKQVKRHIMKNGSVAALTISPQCSNEIYNETTAAEFISPDIENYIDTSEYRHIVSIIGWDDDYSKENFNAVNQPENDGAYIVLNSWGKEFGKDGLFYVSYEDYYIEQNMYGITEASTDKNELKSLKRIQFKDVNLYNKIKEILGKKITIFDNGKMEIVLPDTSINSIEKLDLSDSKISDISGIEEFKNIRYLNLSNNDISNFSKIQELENLDELNLSNCGITDISVLFTQEKNENKSYSILDLSNNNVSNLNTLSKIDLIRELNLSNTDLTDSKLAELDGAKIKSLNISKNTKLTDITSLNSLLIDDGTSIEKRSLDKLDLTYNKNIDLTTIPDGLEALYLANMELKNDDLNKINYENLVDLSLAYNSNITSLDNIDNKEKIRILDLSGDTEINIDNLIEEFIWLDKLIYQNCEIDSIMPLLQYREIEDEYIGKIKRGIQAIDVSYNNINLAENNFEQLQAIIDSQWISSVYLSHNKTTEIINLDTSGHYFLMDLSYNNICPNFYTPDFLFKMDNQDYSADLYIDVKRVNDFKEIGQNLSNIYNTRYAVGNQNILEIEGADFDAKNNSFIITNNIGEQSTIKINGGKFDNSTITYNIKGEDDIELLNLQVVKGSNKRVYIKGEDFDITGMEIYGVYSNNSWAKLDDYEVINGKNLQPDQETITIKKDDKEIEFIIISETDNYYDPNNYWYIVVYDENQVTKLTFENKPLYNYMCKELNNIIQIDDELQMIVLPKKELESIYNLNIISDEIDTLEGLENIIPNLSVIEFNGKNLKDIRALKDYEFFSIEIDNNDALEDLNILKDSDNLAILTLKNTKIKDINKLKNVSELTINSHIIPDFKQIENNLRALFLTQTVDLSELEYENNIYKLPDYMQDVLNGVLPSKIDEQKVEVKVNTEIKYLLRNERYANSSKIEEFELENNNGVWTVNLTDFIKNDDIKDRQIIISIDIIGRWGKISEYSYVINYDKSKSPNSDNDISDSNENESQDNDIRNNSNINKENDNANSESKASNDSVNSSDSDNNIGDSNENESQDNNDIRNNSNINKENDNANSESKASNNSVNSLDSNNNIGDSNENESQDNNDIRNSSNVNKENNNTNSDSKDNNSIANSPKTGDNIEIWFGLMIFLMLGIVGIVKCTRKK